MTCELSSEQFEELYAATARDVLAYVRRRTTGDAEDLVAEVYAVAWRRRADLPAALLRRAWLFGVARRLLLADGRRRREVELTGDVPERPAATVGPAADRTAQVVEAALSRLSAGEREVLRLTAWERLTPLELATALGVRPATARVRLHRARRALAADPEVRALVEEPDRVVTAI